MNYKRIKKKSLKRLQIKNIKIMKVEYHKKNLFI